MREYKEIRDRPVCERCGESDYLAYGMVVCIMCIEYAQQQCSEKTKENDGG